MSNLRPGIRRAALGAGLLVLFAGPGMPTGLDAQERRDPPREVLTLEDIVVTVRKVDERAQDVPLSLVIYNSARIRRDAMRTTEDLAFFTPGLTFDRGVFPNDTRPAMRGIQSERGRPSVAVLIDGHDLSGSNLAVPGGSGTLNLSLHDLERIEVVKGPQSTRFGRNAFAGAVNYITLPPSFEVAGRAGVDVGSFGHRELTASFTGPLFRDQLALRVNAARLEGDGPFTNPVNGGALGGREATGAALSLLYRPTAGISVTGRYQVVDSQESDAPTAFIASNTRLPIPGTELTRASYTGPLSAGIEDVQMGLDPVTGQPPAGLGMDQHIGTWRAEWRTSLGQFTYEGSRLSNEAAVRQDGDFTDFPDTQPFAFSVSSLLSLDYETAQTNHEIRWDHRTGRADWIAGVQRYSERARLVNESQFWVRNPESLLGGPPFFLATAPLDEVPYPVRTRRETSYLGVFAGVGFEATDRIRLSLEARYNRDEADYRVSGWGLEAITLQRFQPGCDEARPQGVPLEPGIINACPQAAIHSSRRITPRATVEYRWSDDAMAYAAYAQGFKPGGYETLEISSFEGRQFLPERLGSWEAGVKTAWLENQLILNGAVYLNDYTDQQIGIQQVDPQTGFAGPRIVNAGEVRAAGAEVGADWRVDDRFVVSLGYAFVDAVFRDFVMGPGAPPLDLPAAEYAAVFEGCGVPVGQTSTPIFRAEAGNECADFSGNQVGRSPRHSLNASVLYRRPLADAGRHLFAQISTMARSRRYTDESNLVWLPGYSVTDLQVGLENPRWTLTAYASNLFDDDRVRTAQRNVDLGRPDGFAPGRGFNAYLPQPRRVGLRFAVNLW
jgi:iron complex outermembrane recepter protein